MKPSVRVFRSLWGVEGRYASFEAAIQALRGLGYDGIEASLPDLGE
jgi:hypothetical protein